MNINISTTQWGGARRLVVRNSTNQRPISIRRSLVLALTTVTLAGFLAIQALGLATADNQAFVDTGAEQVVDLVSGDYLWSGEILSADELLRVELDNGAISSNGGGSMSLPK